MNYNRNVVEDALFQIKNLEETLQENAKGILQSTMSEEIKQLVKESIREQDDDEVEMPVDDLDDEDDDLDDEDDDLDDEDMNMPVDDTDDDETIDMTSGFNSPDGSASDSEVLRVFKAMDPDDEIIIKKEGNNINLKDGDNEYMIRLGESLNEMYKDDMKNNYGNYGDDLGDSDFDYNESPVFEIQMDEDAFGPIDNNFEEENESPVFEIQMDEDKYDSFGDMNRNDYYDEDDYYDEFTEEEDIPLYSEKEDPMMEGDMYGSFGNMRRKDFKGDQYLSDKDRFVGDEEIYGIGDNGLFDTEEYDDFDSYSKKYPEDDDDSIMEAIKKAIKQKGAENRRGPKFSYDKKPNMGGGFDTKRKEAFGKGPKAMGTGKARFEYKEENEKNTMVNRTEKKEGTIMKKRDFVKQETKEASRTYGNGSKDGSRGLRKARTNNRNYEYDPFKISENYSNNEVSLLKEKNEEYKQALDVFRTKLNEVAVFNSNLAYATRLFTEHSTTKQEKINILKRFDNLESIKESKNLYRVIKGELTSGNSNGEQKINESIERTINRTKESGSSVNLIESKTYVNPQFLRMKDLMTKIK